MFFFSILGICVEKTYISMRPWAQPCESNGHANLFMILAMSLSVFFHLVAVSECISPVVVVFKINISHTLLFLLVINATRLNHLDLQPFEVKTAKVSGYMRARFTLHCNCPSLHTKYRSRSCHRLYGH